MLKISSVEIYFVISIIFIIVLIYEYYTHIINENHNQRSLIKASFFNGVRGGLIGLIMAPELAFTNFSLFMITTPVIAIAESIV